MSRLERPLLAKTIALTGDIALRAELTLRIKTNAQSWEPVIFLVDPGTEMTTLPAARAKQLGIPFPQQPVPRLGITGKTAEVRAGHHTTLVALAHLFITLVRRDLRKETPALTLDRTVRLLRATLKLRHLDEDHAVRLVEYYIRRNEIARQSHEKTWMTATGARSGRFAGDGHVLQTG
jgi:hypothetical protein